MVIQEVRSFGIRFGPYAFAKLQTTRSENVDQLELKYALMTTINLRGQKLISDTKKYNFSNYYYEKLLQRNGLNTNMFLII